MSKKERFKDTVALWILLLPFAWLVLFDVVFIIGVIQTEREVFLIGAIVDSFLLAVVGRRLARLFSRRRKERLVD